jgi:hypothetical protein
MLDAMPPRDLDSEGDTPPKRRKLGFGWRLAIGAVVVAGSAVAIHWARSIVHSRRVEVEFARIRAAGEPVTPADLEALYKYPPPNEDVTELWLNAIRPLKLPAYSVAANGLPFVAGNNTLVPPRGEPWAEEEAALRLLTNYSESLRLMHEATEQGGASRFPTNYALGNGLGACPKRRCLRRGAVNPRYVCAWSRIGERANSRIVFSRRQHRGVSALGD